MVLIVAVLTGENPTGDSMSDPNRCTGRTTRMLEAAIKHAREGGFAVAVGPEWIHAKHLFMLAVKLCGEGQEGVKVYGRAEINQIHFEGKGKLRCVSLLQCRDRNLWRGVFPAPEFFFDHTVSEYENAIARALGKLGSVQPDARGANAASDRSGGVAAVGAQYSDSASAEV